MSKEEPCPFGPELRRLLEEELSSEEEERFAAHLRKCPACRGTLDQLAEQDKQLTDAIRHAAGNQASLEIELVQMLQRLRADSQRSADDATTEMPAETGEASAAASSQMSLDFLTPSSLSQSLGKLGEYDILGVIGSGGMGIVLRAQDAALNRIVAIKVLRPELAAHGASRQRFLREAQKAAAITHDHVVTIHAVGEANGLPYIVMEYIVGVSLEERIRRTGPLKVEEILRIGMQSASGLAAAHAQGIVHRDVKPSNILLENGIERVKIADFGLARAADDAQITQAGVVAGTPEFMSPEQARDQKVDYRSDLFSLGSVLYAMCTGRSPFRASSIAAAIHRVCEDTPRPIGDVNRDIPEWLIAIIDRLLAKKPDDRFESATHVAELLGNYLVHLQQPTQFPKPALPQGKTLERKRTSIVKGAWALTCAAIMLCMLWISGLLTPTSAPQATSEPEPGPAPRQVASLSIQLEEHAEGDRGQWMKVSVAGKDFTKTLSTPGMHELEVPAGDYRIEVRNRHTNELNRIGELRVLAGDHRRVRVTSLLTDRPPFLRYRQPLAELTSHSPRGSNLALSRDGRSLAVPTAIGTIQLFELSGEDWKERTSLDASGQQIRRLAFSPDGRWLAAGGDEGVLNLYEVASQGTMQRLAGHSRTVWSLCFSPDSNILVTSGEDSEAIVWDTNTGQLRRRLGCDQGGVVAFSASDSTLAVGDGRGNISLWNAADWRPIRVVPAHSGRVLSVGFSADGARLVSTSVDTTAKIWNVSDGKRLHTFGHHRDWTGAADFSHDGNFVATACNDSGVRVWDTMTGSLLDEFRAHWGPVRDVKFSPDGTSLVSLGADGLIHFWNASEICESPNHVKPSPFEVGTGVQLVATYRQTVEPHIFCLSPDGSKMAIAEQRTIVLTILPELHTVYRRVVDSNATINSVQFIEEETLMIAAGSHIQSRDASTGNLNRSIHHGRNSANFIALLNHNWLAMSHGEGLVEIRCSRTGDIVQHLPHKDYGPSWSLACVRSGSLLAAGLQSGQSILWDLADPSPTPMLLPFGDTKLTSVSFSEDGAMCATGHVNGKVIVWEVGTWRALHTLTGVVGRVRSIAFSEDGRMLVAGGGKGNHQQGAEVDPERWDGRAVIWETRTGRQLTSIHAHLGNTNQVAFTPDGTKLITLGDFKKLKLWDIRELLEQLAPEDGDAQSVSAITP